MSSENQRVVAQIWKSKPLQEGAGVHLKRAFGFYDLPRLDPFLLFDDFRSENPAEYQAGFPWHPHRGIETITYVLDGDVEHGDSMGNRGAISAGDVQWMTAGSGIIHQEMPKGNRYGQMLGFQLWANLPAQTKMMPPRYQGFKAQDIPQIKTEAGALIRVICGEVQGVKGPVQGIVIEPEYLDVELPYGKTFIHSVQPGHTVFAYVIDGEAAFDSHQQVFFEEGKPIAASDGSLVLYAPQGTEVVIHAEKQAVRFLLISGKPLNEPIAWRGPIVMNTQDELQLAFREYREGSFVKT